MIIPELGDSVVIHGRGEEHDMKRVKDPDVGSRAGIGIE